jgi:hypothetical protein
LAAATRSAAASRRIGGTPDDPLDLGGRNGIGQAIAAEQDRFIGREAVDDDFDELGIGRLVGARADLAKHLVPLRMAHRLVFVELSAILELPDWRVVVCQLANPGRPDLVESRIADVTGDELLACRSRRS